MAKIKNIELINFRNFTNFRTSFDDKLNIFFGDNGCGKTNIVDAIRWVLGEQKTKRLRSSKMEDVIFNGASNVKPLGLCEVFLTIENNKGLLPVEYSEVEIGSYPFFKAGKLGVSIVLRSVDKTKIDKCNSEILKFVKDKHIEIVER